jgi:predicted RNA-binding protein associated with RNAse of E/G family
MNAFTIIKRNASGAELLRYSGEVVERGENWVCVRAIFAFGTRDLGYVVMKLGDIFTEWFYADRYYNVFRIEDEDTGDLKGWYCNITRPAEIHAGHLAADDLALDVFVKPDRTLLLLDEAEFGGLPLLPTERSAALAAVTTIQRLVANNLPPFDA